MKARQLLVLPDGRQLQRPLPPGVARPLPTAQVHVAGNQTYDHYPIEVYVADVAVCLIRAAN